MKRKQNRGREPARLNFYHRESCQVYQVSVCVCVRKPVFRNVMREVSVRKRKSVKGTERMLYIYILRTNVVFALGLVNNLFIELFHQPVA